MFRVYVVLVVLLSVNSVLTGGWSWPEVGGAVLSSSLLIAVGFLVRWWWNQKGD